MKYSDKRPIFYFLIFITALSLFLPLPKPLSYIFGLVQAFVLPGLVLLFFIGDKKRPWTDNIFFSPLLSPIMLTLTVFLFSRIFGNLDVAIRLAAGLYYILFASAIILKKDHYGETGTVIRTNVLVFSVFYAVAVAALYFLNDFLLIRSDAWYHASVTNEVLARGIPPMEPYLPETPIRYMWMYHLFIASFKGLSGFQTFRALSFINLAGALALPYLCARIIASIIPEKRILFPATLITVAGLESASWLLWPAFILRALTGEVKGLEEISRNFNAISLKGEGVLFFLTPFFTWMVNLSDKFITITPFGFSLALFLLCFVIFLSGDFIRDSKIKAAILFFIISLGAFLFHIITGTALLCTLIGAGVVLPLIKRYVIGEKGFSISEILPAAAALAAGLIGLPYLSSLGGGTSGEGGLFSGLFHIGIKNISTIILPLIILAYPAWKAAKRIFSVKTRGYAAIASWIVPLMILNIFINLPTRNESKLIYPLFLLLGAIISAEIMKIISGSSGRKKIISAALVLILFLAPPLLTFRAFLIDSPEGDEIFTARYNATKGDSALFQWIENNTAGNAVLMEKDFYHLAPVLAARRNFSASLKYWTIYGYDESLIKTHLDLNHLVYACENSSDESVEAAQLQNLNLYIIVFNSDLEECQILDDKFNRKPERFEKAYSGPEGTIYHKKMNP